MGLESSSLWQRLNSFLKITEFSQKCRSFSLWSEKLKFFVGNPGQYLPMSDILITLVHVYTSFLSTYPLPQLQIKQYKNKKY